MEDFRSVGKRLSNWSRWGADDQRGALNFITPEVIARAAGCIRTGKVFELSIPLSADGPQTGLGGRVNPLHFLTVLPTDEHNYGERINISDDFLSLSLQGATQWDSLAHFGYDDLFYNNVPVGVVTTRGAARNAIDQLLPGVVGRGILLDAARARGVEWLEAGQAIGPDDLDAIVAATGVTVSSGDILAVRTGWRRRALIEGWAGWMHGSPGLSLECADWIHDHEIAAVVCDNYAVEVLPSPKEQGILPVHCVLLRDMGVVLGEIFDLEALAEDCAADGIWEFFLCAAPLRVVGGVGSPVSPIAIK